MLDMEVGKIYMFPVRYFETLNDLLKVVPENIIREYTSWCHNILDINKDRRIGIKKLDGEDSYQYFEEKYLPDTGNITFINGVLGGLWQWKLI